MFAKLKSWFGSSTEPSAKQDVRGVEAANEQIPETKKILWERVYEHPTYIPMNRQFRLVNEVEVDRAKIPDGWLVRTTHLGKITHTRSEAGLGGYDSFGPPIISTTFVFDPNHRWELKR